MSSAPPLTAATMLDRVLWPVMDARALNLEQDKIADGLALLAEALDGARSKLPPGFGAALVSLAARLDTSNEVEGRLEQGIAGTADGIARTMRGRELAQNGSPFTARAIARRLRDPLGVIANPEDHTENERCHAFLTVGEVLGAVPAAQIFTDAVEYELGAEKFAALSQLRHGARSSV